MIIRKWINFTLFVFFCLAAVSAHQTALASDDVTLYTPYTKIFVSPGESIDYSIDLINNSNEIQNKEIAVTGFPRNWTYTLTSGGYKISQVAVLKGEKKNFSLKVNVPYQVNKGTYKFKVTAGNSFELPLIITVTEKGSYESEMTTTQPNMQGSSTSNFTFNVNLKNRTTEQQLYGLFADVGRGWNVVFKADYKPVTSVEMAANTTKDISVEITPPSNIEAGTYQIPISARTSSTSAKLQLEVVITGTYSMELTTPSGLLSDNITAGSDDRIELVVKNTGSSVLSGIKLSASTPSNWSVTFEPNKIANLLAGKEEQVFAVVKADKKAIPGDYVLNLEAQTPETTSKATFRMTVETPMLWGWIGVLIIVLALASVFYLFRKYGRR